MVVLPFKITWHFILPHPLPEPTHDHDADRLRSLSCPRWRNGPGNVAGRWAAAARGHTTRSLVEETAVCSVFSGTGEVCSVEREHKVENGK